MSTYVDIHQLTPLGPNNMNRGDDNMPKTVVFGGVARPDLSSQSQKSAVRKRFVQTFGEEGISLRSKVIPLLITRELQNLDPSISEEKALEITGYATALFTVSGKKANRDKAHGEVTEAVKSAGAEDADPYRPILGATFQMSLGQARAVAAVIDSALKNGIDFADPKVTGNAELTKELVFAAKDQITPDVALFGKMMASNNALSVDAVCQVAHAFGVTAYAGDLDFYTAMDELRTISDTGIAKSVADLMSSSPGADMMDHKGLWAGTIYRYANVNVSALHATLGDPESVAHTVRGFVEEFATALPGGAQNGFAARGIFSTLVLAVRHDQPLSFAGAYEETVDTAAQAALRMAEYGRDVNAMWGTPAGDPVFALSINHRDALVEALGADGSVVSLPALLDRLGGVVDGALR